MQSILDLVNRCVADEERTDALMRLAYGLIGDLADCFPNGEIKQLLLANWIAAEFRTRHRMPDETKKTLRWAREVCAWICYEDCELTSFFLLHRWSKGPLSRMKFNLFFVEDSLCSPFFFLLYHSLPVSLCLFSRNHQNLHAISLLSVFFHFLVIS